ncbi:unnamed protein product [Rodentolepis nana]|uniref:DUF5737 domain-containing protein n=1 Tax=Rodentolepis nana TaxID=102285 RepID=A0A0R3TQD5_RODNA|nr:unnamed protein product [Rodentolepis nana]
MPRTMSLDKRLASGPVSFGHTRKESAYDFGFTQAQVKGKTCYYLVYRELVEAMDRKAPRCFIEMDEKCVRIVEKKYPFEEVTIFIKDIMSYFKFDHSSKFVALCIDANKAEKSGYWFINFDTEQQLEEFCDCLNKLFAWEKQKNAVKRTRTIQCWCCGADIVIPPQRSYIDNGYNESLKSKSSRWSSSKTSSSSSPALITYQPLNTSTTRRVFRRI